MQDMKEDIMAEKLVQETSVDAYNELNDLGDRQKQVLETISYYESCSNTMIAKHLGLPISSITPRTRELVKKGFVEEGHKALDPYTHKKVIFWRLTE